MTIAEPGRWPRLTFGQRLRRAVQLEDLLLAAFLIAAPLLRDAATADPVIDRRPDIIGGLIAFLAVVGAIACLATRAPGESPIDPIVRQSGPDARMAFIGPLLGAIALVGDAAFSKLGVGGGGILTVTAFVVGVASFVLAPRLPVVRPQVRRALVMPFVLVCGGTFQSLVGDLTDGLDLRGYLAGSAGASSGDAALLLGGFGGLLILAAAVFYTMLVYAPRELAEAGTSARSWVVRFAMFVLFTAIGLLIRSSS